MDSRNVEYSAVLRTLIGIKLDSMAQTRSTGFLDMPLELRQMVYRHILPRDRMMCFPADQHRPEVSTVNAVCATHPQISEELQAMVYKCSARIIVTPDKETGIPEAIYWDRFQGGIRIEIDHYEDDYKNIYRWDGMRELIRCLHYGRPKFLRNVTIKFSEDFGVDEFSTRWGGDPMWTKHVRTGETRHSRGYDSEDEYEWKEDEDVSDGDIDVWLRTEHGHPGNPILAEILDYFFELPPCGFAVVYGVCGCNDRRARLPRYDRKNRIFDQPYMEDLSNALCVWLLLDLEGIELPLQYFSDETRLERLAYSWHEGGLFCDDDPYYRD